LVKGEPTQSTSSAVDDDDLFSFGPTPKKRRNSPEDEHNRSVKDEFLSFFKEACRKRRKFEDFWALHKTASFYISYFKFQIYFQQFPLIYILSKKLLTAPASTGLVERLFSQLAIHTNDHKTNSKAKLTRARVLSSDNSGFLGFSIYVCLVIVIHYASSNKVEFQRVILLFSFNISEICLRLWAKAP
jgi:hypothetical protein